MNYVIDPFVGILVLISDDETRTDAVAQLYANQVGHGILVATGPAPADSQFEPLVLSIVTPGVTLPIVEGSVPRRIESTPL